MFAVLLSTGWERASQSRQKQGLPTPKFRLKLTVKVFVVCSFTRTYRIPGALAKVGQLGAVGAQALIITLLTVTPHRHS